MTTNFEVIDQFFAAQVACNERVHQTFVPADDHGIKRKPIKEKKQKKIKKEKIDDDVILCR